MAKMYGKGKTAIESEEQAKLRWQVELEFVQCLANPNYLNFLAQRGYLKDQAFINYLKYLQYWKEPDYAKYLMYPMCLYFLDLLQYEHFRREIVNSQCCKFIDDQVILMWQHYTRKRNKLLNAVNGVMPINMQTMPIDCGAASGTMPMNMANNNFDYQQKQQQQQQQQQQPAPAHCMQNGIGGPPHQQQLQQLQQQQLPQQQINGIGSGGGGYGSGGNNNAGMLHRM